MAGDDDNRPKRHVSHHLGHRFFLIFFFVFSINSLIIFVFLGSIYVPKAREGLGWPAMMKTGPFGP